MTIKLSACSTCDIKEENAEKKYYTWYTCEMCGHKQFEYVSQKPKICNKCAKENGICFICLEKNS